MARARSVGAVRRRGSAALAACLTALTLAAAAPQPVHAQGADDGLIVFTAGLDFFGGTLGSLLGSEERGGIFAMRPDGSDLRQLTSFRSFNFVYEGDVFHLPDDHPTLSADGRRVLFSSTRLDDDGVLGGVFDDDEVEVFVMDANGAGLRRITTSPGFDGEASFSPDGTRIAYVSDCGGVPAGTCTPNRDVYVMDVDGNVLQRITNSPRDEVEPAWSPDGKRLAFTLVTDEGSPVLGDEEKEVLVSDADGLNENRRFLTSTPGQDHDASFHPGGTSLAITSERAGTFPYGDVVRLRADSGALLANLTIDDRIAGVGGGGDPHWSPDGSRIAYIKARLGILHGPQKIHVMNADGSGKRRLDAGIPGLVNIHQNWGVLADSDGDGTPDYLENTNTSFNREAVSGFALFGEQVGARSQPGERFGGAVGLADLTHDGRLDLVAASPDLNGPLTDSGGVAIVPGTQFGPQFAPTLLLGLAPLFAELATARPEPASGGGFGEQMARGDFNGDGFSDLAIGAPGQNRVFIMYGGLSSQVLTGAGEFGRSLAAGDFDRDGRSDLAVGAPGESRPAPGGGIAPGGAVRVFSGAPDGLAVSPRILDQASLPVDARAGRVESGDRFGAALAAGDLNGNGTQDLAVGVPREDLGGVADAGLVHVVPGLAGQGLSAAQAVQRDIGAVPLPTGGLQNGALFGSAVAIGNFRGGVTRVRDLVVGAPGQDVSPSVKVTRPDAGVVAVFDGANPLVAGGAELLGSAVRGWSAATLADAPQAHGRLGEVLAVGDVSGDGVGDLVVAAPGQTVASVPAGAVYLVLGTRPPESICTLCGGGGGLEPATAQRVDQGSVGTRPEAGDRFGAGLAVGDMDEDGQQDVFIGSPGEDGRAGVDTGLVSIRYGIDVGTFAVRPAASVVIPGRAVDLGLTWTHPERWRDLRSVHLRLRGQDAAPLWLRFDAVDRTLEIVGDDDPRGLVRGRLGANGFLRDEHVSVDLRDSELVTSGPEGRDVTLDLALRFHPRAPTGTFAVEVLATDVHGNSQGFERAGTLEVRWPRRPWSTGASHREAE